MLSCIEYTGENAILQQFHAIYSFLKSENTLITHFDDVHVVNNYGKLSAKFSLLVDYGLLRGWDLCRFFYFIF